MNLSGREIYEQMNQGIFGGMLGSMSISSAQDSALKSSKAHRDLDDTLRQFQGKMSEAWKGKASDSAHESLQPMFERTKRAADGLGRTEGSLRGQSENYERSRASLVEMKKGRDEYSADMDDVTMGVVDAETAKAMWDESNRHNIHQYKKYKETSDSHKGELLTDFEHDDSSDDKDKGGSDDGDDSTGKEWVRGPGRRGDDSGEPGGPGGRTSGSSGDGPGSSSGPGQGSSSSGSGSGPQSGSHVPGSPNAGQHSDQTSSAGFGPSGSSDSGHGSGSSHGGFGPVGAGGGSGGSHGGGSGTSVGGGSAGGAALGGGAAGGGSGGGSPSGGGARGSGSASGSGGQSPGGGRSSGSAPPGSGGGGTARGATGAVGGSGGSGGSGGGRPPMMGAPGGGKGGGGDEEEHERKFVLPTSDPDDIFGGIPEGSIVVPPVIGE